jgi:hypothetical protein
MDQQNQVINPTLTKKRASSVKHLAQVPVEQPATTAKHDARVELRRQQQELKKAEQERLFKEEVDRYIKQNRLQQRVKCSPALISNGQNLAQKR